MLLVNTDIIANLHDKKEANEILDKSIHINTLNGTVYILSDGECFEIDGDKIDEMYEEYRENHIDIDNPQIIDRGARTITLILEEAPLDNFAEFFYDFISSLEKETPGPKR
jgi:hypothetical protein